MEPSIEFSKKSLFILILFFELNFDQARNIAFQKGRQGNWWNDVLIERVLFRQVFVLRKVLCTVYVLLLLFWWRLLIRFIASLETRVDKGASPRLEELLEDVLSDSLFKAGNICGRRNPGKSQERQTFQSSFLYKIERKSQIFEPVFNTKKRL